MKGKITIFNYEAFYLDLLEGNLNEEDTLLLREFLHEHPECEIDMDDLPVLASSNLEMNWSELKMIDESDPITTENAEHFIIASHENVITKEKQVELESFLAHNLTFEALNLSYSKIKLVADTNLSFGNKDQLKKERGGIVLWPYFVSTAAAAIAILIYFGVPTSSDGYQTPEPPSNRVAKKETIEKELPETAFILNNSQVTDDYQAQEAGPIAVTSVPKNNSSDAELINTTIKPRKFRNVLSEEFNRTLEPVAFVEPVTQATDHLIDVAYSPENQMVNPIEPVTRFISNKTNIDVDYKQRKKTRREKGGFYLKIGKLEVSRNVH